MNAQQTLSLKDLQARYPYQFSEPRLGIAMAKGWVVVFAQLCADVDHALGQDKRGFHWSQVKEKFGSARFYFEFAGRQPDLRLDLHTPDGLLSQVVPSERQVRSDDDRSFEQVNAEIRQLALAAEAATRRVCLVCGKEGHQDVDGGYALVLCPEHQSQRREPQGLPNFWDSLLDEKGKAAMEQKRLESVAEIERILARLKKDDEV